MGGVVFIVATVIAYVAGHLALTHPAGPAAAPAGPTTTGLVLLGLFVGLGAVGFIDDFLKVRKRNSLGLNKRGKLIGQLVVGAVFGDRRAASSQRRASGLTTVASTTSRSSGTSTWLDIGKVGAVIVFVFVVIATSNAVNLTDGLDGLATGASVMVLGGVHADRVLAVPALVRRPGLPARRPYCYEVRDPLEIALIAGGGRRRLRRLPVVEHVAGPDLHGRHRRAGARRPDRRPGDGHPDGCCCCRSSAACS